MLELTEIQKEMLREMLTWYEYCYGYWKFDIVIDGMAVLRPRLQKEMKGLMRAGLVECVHGLINDDGEVCGSGFSVVYPKIREVESLITEDEPSLPQELSNSKRE